MLEQRGQLLRAALFAGLSMPWYDRSLWALRTWLDSWAGIGPRGRRQGPAGLRSPAHPVRRARLARDLLPGWHGALAHERDGHRMGAHALARGAAGGVGGAEESSYAVTQLLVLRQNFIPLDDDGRLLWRQAN